MQPAEPRRHPGPLIAVMAIFGVLLAVLIVSCSGDGDEAELVAATTAASEPAVTVTAPPETQEEVEASGETETVEESEETETVETETVETVEEAPATTDETSTTPEDDQQSELATLPEALAEDGSYTTLLRLLEASTLAEALTGEGPYTVFAPTDDAFAELPEEVLAALEDDPTALEQLLTYHVVAEAIAPDALVPGSLTTLEGQPVEITERAGVTRVNDARVLEPAVEAGNGWAYPVELVLLPPDLDLASLVGEEQAAAAYDRADFVVFFETGSSDLDGEAQQTIDEAAGEIASLPAGSTVRLVGVADPEGDAAANRALSRERAESVQAALEQAAPDADVTYVVRARGEEEAPRLTNARRVDIILPS